VIEAASTPFPTDLARATFYNKYSRWDHDLGRRESKPESINRALNFLWDRAFVMGANPEPYEFELVDKHMHQLDALCSMRLLWSAGPALARNHIMAYNCAYRAVNSLDAFSESLYILMSGTGVGYSVEGEYVDNLPRIKKQKKTGAPPDVFVIQDSTEGWCDALDAGIECWWNGYDVEFDARLVRPNGSILKTKGGRASGPQPLLDALKQIRTIILNRQGRNCTTIMAHDIMCLIAQVVVVGGIRRASLISLSDLDDPLMRDAKFGEFWNATPWRSMANNSVAYNEMPSDEEFLSEWSSMVRSKSGERGIFNREAFRVTSPRRKRYGDTGCNPCGEINLRDKQFCNLTSIACYPDDNRDTLADKVKAATIMGTIQASLTDFPYISDKWKENCDEEALLGVSATGQMGCPAFRDPEVMRYLRGVAIETNKDWAERMDIQPSVAITTSKPEGTRSLLVNTSSGAHTWWGKYFKRRMRLNTGDPMLDLFRVMGKTINPDPVTPATWVVDFICKAPEGAVTRHDLTAVEQFDYALSLKTNYTEHNPSMTIYYKEGEAIQLASRVRENWDKIGGLSFLPSNDHTYALAPYEEITPDEFHRLLAAEPVYTDEEFAAALAALESEDNTTGATEFACTSGTCDIP
jgi:ribonucleoside-triphosphate reductase